VLVAGLGAYLGYPLASSAYHERLARQALAAHELMLAQSHLQRSLALRPRSRSAHLLLAQALRRAGDFDSAAEHLQAARALGCKEADLHLEELLLQAQSGVVAPVERALQLYLADHTGDPHLIFEALVRGCLQGQLVDRAYHYSNLWTHEFPHDPHARFWQGRALEQGLRYDLAAEAYEQVLGQHPDHLLAQLHLGKVQLWRGRYPEAVDHLQSYLARRPDDPDALLALARCQHALGTPEEARETLDRLFALPGVHPEGCLLRGQLELSALRPSDALPWLEQALERIPHDRAVNLALASTLHQLHRHVEAKRYEQRHRDIERDLHRIEELTKQILASPADVALRYEAGTTLVRLGQDAQAIRWFVSALLLHKQHQPTRQALAACIHRLGDPKLSAAYRPLLADPLSHQEPLP
jgi:tetratricopeptide (TPR) repeat protein